MKTLVCEKIEKIIYASQISINEHGIFILWRQPTTECHSIFDMDPLLLPLNIRLSTMSCRVCIDAGENPAVERCFALFMVVESLV